MANTNCFLDYAGLELFWSKVKEVIENNELVTANAITNLDTRIDNLEGTKSDIGHTHDDRYYTESEVNNLLANKSNTNHTHTFSSLTSKPTTISGYGITDALKIDGSNGTSAGVSALINKLSAGSSDPTDADYYVCQYAGGGTTTTSYHRRPMSAMWNWIKAKTDTLYPTKSGSGATGNWGISISGNAATATTATKIGTSTVGSSIMPVYINAGTPTAITSFPEAYLSWGGTNTSGSVTPIGMTLSSEHSANRLAFINGNALTFEYSSDAGSTWTDYGYNASIKSQVFTTSCMIDIGRANSSTEYTINSRTRITLTAQDGTNSYVYTNPRKMLINISSSGGMQVLIEYRTGTNYKNNGVWTTFGTYTLSGWSGWNDIPLVLNTLGGGSTQTSNTWQLRLTFIMTSKNANYPKSASVNCIRIFGENAWTCPSTMATTGHLYSYDIGQNATFPAAITSTKFVKSGGTSSQFLKADGSVDSNTYSKSNHTHTSVLDVNGSTATTFAYSKTGLSYGDYTWLAGWNGYELRAINKSQFAQASHTHTKSQITDFPTSLPASDVYSWAKQSTKPSYSFSEITSKPTTLAGYGITETDGYLNKISKSGNTLTITPKGGTAFTFTNTPLVSVTYSELKALRDAGQLVPGQQYRITDYTCTTTQANTRSVGHVFDIIVTADSANTLNEVARAIKHVGDSYFRACNLNAWKIWYCLDNDTNRFIWADSTNGKGVIYRMIDEHGNDCPYDFKNIQYNGSWGYWAYTFNWICDNSDNTCVDLSVDSRVNDMGGDTYAYGNVIKPCDNGINDINYGFSLCLNACVFLNTESYSDDMLSFGCHNNIFGNNCYNNTFGHDCYNNTFGPDCNNITFGGGCYNNTFGSDCHNNTFGGGCYSNTFGNGCNYNTFGSNCLINTFGSYYGSNTFGNSCNYNTFGNSCNYNTFGNSCHANIFGNNCKYIKFVTSTGGTTPADYYSYNKFDNGVSYVKLYNAATASYTQQVQYYHIVAGVNGTSSTYKNISVDRGRTYDTTVSKIDGAEGIAGYNLAMMAVLNGYAEELG